MLLECEVESSLSFRKPTPSTIGEGRVPLIPQPARFVFELSASGQLERHSVINTGDIHVENRTGLDQIGHLAEVFEIPIAPSNSRVAVLANDDNRRADL